MQKAILTLLVVSLGFLTLLQSKPLNPKKVVYAIDCGGFTNTKSALGFIYNKDEGFTESRVSDYNNNEELQKVMVQYTNDQSVYKTERHHDDSFGYDVPLANNGKYVLILKFSEMYFKEAGKRVFNVRLGDRTVVQDLDIVARVGPFAAYDEYIEFELKDDQIYFNGEVCPKAYRAKSQKLVFELQKGKRDLPKMEAFLVYEGTLKDTDYFEQDQIRSEWKSRIEEEKRIQEEEKRQRTLAKKKLMENLGKGALEFDDNQESILEGIFRVLRQKEGIAIFGTLFSCLILLFLFGADPK